MTPFEIVTERLVLKPLDTSYLETTNEYTLDPENTQHMRNMPFTSSDETLAYLKDIEEEWACEHPFYYGFAVMYKGQHIGAVGVLYQGIVGQLDWIINKKYWRQGFAYEAINGLIDCFAERRGTVHFAAYCYADNIASRGLMEKLGMIETEEYWWSTTGSGPNDKGKCQYELLVWMRPQCRITRPRPLEGPEP